MSRRYVSTDSWAANNKCSYLVLVALFMLGLVTRADALGQACSYFNTAGGTCKFTSDCFGAYGPTQSGKTTGCQTDPDPNIQCCLVKSCSASQGSGTCRKTSECFGTTVTSSAGATGCQSFPADTTCCILGPNPTPPPTPPPTPRPTPRPPSPTPFPTPRPPIGPTTCTDGRGESGTCETTAACSGGTSTTSANGANGCQSAGSNVFCCTYPSCSAQGVSGTCSDTTKSCFFSRVSKANGASGCDAYPAGVNCCLDGPLPNPVPSPTPPPSPPFVQPTPLPTPSPFITPSPPSGISQVGNPCMAKGVSGTCQFPSACSGLATLPADGASGCLGTEVMCCTTVACLWIDPFGQKETTDGQCRHKVNQSPCPTITQTMMLGASGCNLYNANIVCCLDQLPVPKAMPRTPPPTPPQTPAPTPAIPPAPSSTCQYMGDEGMCVADPSCVGIGLRANEGATGCAFSTDVSVVCCVQRPCTVTDPTNGEREGLCRATRRCQADGQASYELSDGASGCEVFGQGNNCCSEPVAPPDGATAPPTQPPVNTGLSELSCSAQTTTGRRDGTCVEAENCDAEFHPPNEAGFMGCRNAAQFANRGCCIVRQTSPAPTGACTPGDPKTCPLGEQCQMVGGAPTCIVDRNFDCKAAGGCVVGGQECAPDGPNGAYVCGAARTCRVVPCQRADAMCIADTRGFAQCVVAGDCFQNTCSFDQECRPDPRGTRFPSVCAQKQVRNTPSPTTSSSSGMPDWLIGVIAGACILVCLILICIIVAVVVALRNRNDMDYNDAAFNGTPMVPMTVQNAAFSSGYGSGQYGSNGNYPAAMGAGSNSIMYPSGMAGQSHSGTMMTGYGSTASELGRGGGGGFGANPAYPSGSFNGGGYGAAGGGSMGYGGGAGGAGGYGAGGEVYPSFRTPAGSVGYSPNSRPAF